MSLTTQTLDDEGRSSCVWMRACVRVVCVRQGAGPGVYRTAVTLLVLDLLEREDVTYKVDSTVNADRSLSS